MGNGRKNYFRHSIHALDDPKIQEAISILGIKAHAYYFIMIELVAKSCLDGYTGPVRIHKHTLRVSYRTNHRGTKKVLDIFQSCGLMNIIEEKNSYQIDVPNLSKYLGKYNKTEKKSGIKSGDKEKAQELAKKIFLSLGKFGSSDINARKEYLGDDGLKVCQALGGWSKLAFSNTIPESFMMKRLTDACLDQLKESSSEEN